MRLTELNPRWCSADGMRVGFSFECPCCLGTDRSTRLMISTHHRGYEVEEDLAIRLKLGDGVHIWTIDNDDFATLSATPSVDASAHGHWHGFITNGIIR